MKQKRFYYIAIFSLLILLVVVYEIRSNVVAAFPDAPASMMTDTSRVAMTNFFQKADQPFTAGFDILNQGTSDIIIDTVDAITLPEGVKVVAKSFAIPDENDRVSLGAGAVGYPPFNERLKKPWVLHPLHNAVVRPKQYAEAIIVVKGPHPGIFTIKGLQVIVKIDGQMYKRFYNASIVLCLNVADKDCTTAFKAASNS